MSEDFETQYDEVTKKYPAILEIDKLIENITKASAKVEANDDDMDAKLQEEFVNSSDSY